MDRQEAIDNAVAAARLAEGILEKGDDMELAYSWTILADTWASIASAMPEEKRW